MWKGARALAGRRRTLTSAHEKAITSMAVRDALGAAVLWTATAAVSAPGHAHPSLVGADPADGARLESAPQVLRLVFSEPIEVRFSRFALGTLGPDMTADEVSRKGLIAALGGGTLPRDAALLTPAGRSAAAEVVLVPAAALVPRIYVLVWRVLSTDGHHIGGSLTFEVTAPRQ